MAFVIKNLVADNSTLANFTSWSTGIGTSFISAGWVQTNDTGQAVWTATVVSITNAAGNGTIATFTYTLTSGPALRAGMSIVVTGCTTAGFNATYTILSLPTGSTFTVASTTNVTEAEPPATGTVNTNVSLPTANTYPAYEIYRTADTLSAQLPIYVKMEYGANTAANGPQTAITVGTGSSGTGSITGNGTGRMAGSANWANNTGQPNNSLWECDFSWYNAAGGGNGIAIIMYRNLQQNGLGAGNYQNQLPWMFILERSHDSNGNDTAEFVTINMQRFGINNFYHMVAAANGSPGQVYTYTNSQLYQAPYSDNSATAVGGLAYLVPVYPIVGKICNPMRTMALGKVADFADGAIVPMSIYGTTQNYLMTRQSYAGNWLNYGSYNVATPPGLVGIRWDSGA